ncbi:MAG: PSD1 and planctomycete cytochrome C domain-containing protein [Fuerstiella sp.]
MRTVEVFGKMILMQKHLKIQISAAAILLIALVDGMGMSAGAEDNAAAAVHGAAAAVDQQGPVVAVDFERDVYSVLQRSCFECHGAAKQEGDLRLDSAEALLDSGTVIPKAVKDSELIRRVLLPKGHDEVMPAIGDPLSPKEVEGLQRWVASGAVWPAEFKAKQHWSYIPPVRPTAVADSDLQQLKPGWGRNEIDGFVAQRLLAEGLQPSAEADPTTLVRRAHFDIIGLPPTPAEVNAFAANPTDEAYERLVDELFSRPQFGERWARQWLDLARYADSHGFQRDDLRDVWAYRDWVIRALNDDMPFDRFTIEQVAGDLLPDATEAQKIATGFHRCTPTNVEAGSLPEETRIEQVIDRVNTTGAVWLGTTMECCQCHDHKYDPFSQKDYYGLLAFFNNTEMEADRTNPDSPSSIQFKGPTMAISNVAADAQRAEIKTKQMQFKAKQSARTESLAADLADWVAGIAETAGKAPQVHDLEVVEFRSTGTVDSYQVLDDGSVLLVGTEPPETDIYEVTVRTDVKNITAFRLDALTHESLPGGGPGRGDPERTNFVLNHFSATVSEPADQSGDANRSTQQQSVELTFSGATADFSQKGYDVADALSDVKRSGWAIAPQFKKPHWAQFRLAEALDASAGQLITFKLVHDFGSARSIGRLKLAAVTGNPEFEALPKNVAAAMVKSPLQWSKKDEASLLKYRVQQDPELKKIAAEISQLDDQLSKLESDTTLVMVELPEPRMSYLFERGDYRNKGEVLQAATPKALHAMPDGPPNRLTLAKWLVDPANPLVARVTVNRWWSEIFGRGIVPTAEDFGIKGDAPSHPELLDWLAVEFMENGWSRKKLLRKIVLSSTYRQSSFASPELYARDDANQLLARGPRFRMSAEMIRDNLLAVSGLLDLKQFGPSIRPYQPDGIWSKVGGQNYKYEVSPGSEQYRRGLYVVLKRGAPYPSFMNFDASARLACTVQRSRTNTPLQALTLLNDPVYVAAAEALARRVLQEKQTATIKQQIEYAFQLCTGRNPTKNEIGVLLDLWETQHSVSVATSLKQVDDKKSDKAKSKFPAGVSAAEFSAWKAVATTLLNLHETITKN